MFHEDPKVLLNTDNNGGRKNECSVCVCVLSKKVAQDRKLRV